MKQKIAIMGGTFDPIHLGHLMIAETVRSDAGMDRILFIPSGNPPHKQDHEITSPEDRFEMTRLAIADHPFFDVSRIEIDRPGTTYTYDTMRALNAENDGFCDYYFILGADAFDYVPHWKEAEKVIQEVQFLVVARPGYTVAPPANMPQIRYQTVEMPQIDISSTDIRNRAKEGRSIRYLVPEPVRAYIEERKIYS